MPDKRIISGLSCDLGLHFNMTVLNVKSLIAVCMSSIVLLQPTVISFQTLRHIRVSRSYVKVRLALCLHTTLCRWVARP
jgi:ABC-type uncharacterized transport system permease subunit